MYQYPLLHNDLNVGTVSVEQEGLYCRIICVCRKDELINRSITARTEKGCVHLGKCTIGPEGYILRRFLPAKTLGCATPVFHIGDESDDRERVILLNSSVAFHQIAQLPHARFVAGQSGGGIVMEDNNECRC